MENTYITKSSEHYELLDSGDGKKLERFGNIKISRPDPQAIWEKRLEDSEWKNVDASFEQSLGKGKWKNNKDFPENWTIELEGIKFLLKPSLFKHVGVFPEQSVNWKWLSEKIKSGVESGRKVSVLNLFGYTGGFSLSSAKAGASVCHVDASLFSVNLAMKNKDISGLSECPIRFIVEDVRKFVDREVRRGNKYDVIVMDPPVYGKGAKNEIWKIEEDLIPLLLKTKKLISDDPIAIVLNGYASGFSHITYSQILSSITKDFKGKNLSGELTIEESKTGRLLPSGIFAKFEFEK